MHRLLSCNLTRYELLVSACWTRRCLRAYTPLLSNSCFTSILRCLVSRGVSCLDAFSIYPVARSCPACPAGQQVDQRRRDSVPLVLEIPSIQTSASPVDIKQTASQRSEPSSWSLLIGEHPHPWMLLHTQDRKSRHRCSKPRRRLILEEEHIMMQDVNFHSVALGDKMLHLGSLFLHIARLGNYWINPRQNLVADKFCRV